MISCLCALLLAAPSVVQASAHSDFSGVDRFWSIAATLTVDSEPAPGDWQHLFATPAYRTLDRDVRLQRLLRIAYLPSARRQRDSLLAAATYDARQVRHLLRARDQRDQLLRFRDSLMAADLAAAGTLLAAAYLPPGETARRGPPPIAFAFFEPAAYGAETGITIDLLFAMDRGVAFVPIVAHEIHHYHTAYLSGLSMPERTSPYYTLLQSLRNLANEGTADRINLTFPVGPPAVSVEVTPAYNEAYQQAASTVSRLDSLFAALNTDTSRVRTLGDSVSKRLVYAGHPVGAYMAQQIERRLGRTVLIAAVGNPFAFLRRFNEAEARAAGSGPISPPALAAVAVLEKKFFVAR